MLVPVARVVAIYARENGQGMAFELDPQAPDDDDDALGERAEGDPDAGAEGDEARASARPGHLKVIK